MMRTAYTCKVSVVGIMNDYFEGADVEELKAKQVMQNVIDVLSTKKTIQTYMIFQYSGKEKLHLGYVAKIN